MAENKSSKCAESSYQIYQHHCNISYHSKNEKKGKSEIVQDKKENLEVT